ncbi:hypothetical protein UFOVP95_34 [uncultured Caudovirales phage]|uniref:Uncharacterized protein n=1 Tax=uncultured Caudovirales phage TaxID=2100421 RepID=A0A6J5L1V1_9CAUD|nr:hypothetical protein UFOVP95_34 [uncultured Caudovirales phage]
MMDTIEQLMIELGSEKAKLKSWSRHYDELDQRFEKLCDALYKIVGLEEHELNTAPWAARIALQEVEKWPK